MNKKHKITGVGAGILLAGLCINLVLYAQTGETTYSSPVYNSSILDLIKAEGIFGHIIILCGIFVIIRGIIDAYKLRMKNIAHPETAAKLESLINDAQYDQALTLCQIDRNNLTGIIEAGLINRKDGAEGIIMGIEESANKSIIKLSQKPVKFLFIGVIALMLGLLGTVTGIINTFGIIATKLSPSPGDYARGFEESLITTTEGLIVAIICVFFYFHIRAKASYYILELGAVVGRIMAELKRKG
jgi:biopolymer transport protein ExbB